MKGDKDHREALDPATHCLHGCFRDIFVSCIPICAKAGDLKCLEVLNTDTLIWHKLPHGLDFPFDFGCSECPVALSDVATHHDLGND